MAERSSRRWISVTRGGVDCIGHRRAGREGGRVPTGISLDEWLLHVAADSALERVRLAANENEALREACPVRVLDPGTDRWLYWMGGELWVTMPDAAMLTTVRRIARMLGADVVDQDDVRRRSAPRRRDDENRPCVRRIVSPRTQGLPSGDPIDRSGHRRGLSSARVLPGRSEAGATDAGRREEGGKGAETGAVTPDDGDRDTARNGSDAGADDPDRLSRRVHEEAIVERQARQALIVAGTVVCVVSVMWLMKA